MAVSCFTPTPPPYILPVQGATPLPFNIDAGFVRFQGATLAATQAATLSYLPATGSVPKTDSQYR